MVGSRLGFSLPEYWAGQITLDELEECYIRLLPFAGDASYAFPRPLG